MVPALADKLKFESGKRVRLPKIEIDELNASVNYEETATLPLTTRGEAVETVTGTVSCKNVELDNHTPSTQLKEEPGDPPAHGASSDGGIKRDTSFKSTASKGEAK